LPSQRILLTYLSRSSETISAQMNALDPNQMSAAQGITAIAEILVIGLMCLRARKSTEKSADFRKSSLALSRQQRGHAEAVGRAMP
jgi:hypothetical protein